MKDKGIEFAKQAVADDEAELHEKALKGYMTALEYFGMYMKYEKNLKAKEIVKNKVSSLVGSRDWGFVVPCNR